MSTPEVPGLGMTRVSAAVVRVAWVPVTEQAAVEVVAVRTDSVCGGAGERGECLVIIRP